MRAGVAAAPLPSPALRRWRIPYRADVLPKTEIRSAALQPTSSVQVHLYDLNVSDVLSAQIRPSATVISELAAFTAPVAVDARALL
jgi:hypothetical protein